MPGNIPKERPPISERNMHAGLGCKPLRVPSSGAAKSLNYKIFRFQFIFSCLRRPTQSHNRAESSENRVQ